jgi:hypothetical protein
VSKEKPQTRKVSEHPGWFGWGYGGSHGEMILGIQADWSAYPCAPGGSHGLFDLAQFPEGTRFFPIDDIDRCVLSARTTTTRRIAGALRIRCRPMRSRSRFGMKT